MHAYISSMYVTETTAAGIDVGMTTRTCRQFSPHLEHGHLLGIACAEREMKHRRARRAHRALLARCLFRGALARARVKQSAHCLRACGAAHSVLCTCLTSCERRQNSRGDVACTTSVMSRTLRGWWWHGLFVERDAGCCIGSVLCSTVGHHRWWHYSRAC